MKRRFFVTLALLTGALWNMAHAEEASPSGAGSLPPAESPEFADLLQKAQGGDAQAQFLLAACYLSQKKEKEFVTWLVRAAQAGNLQAQSSLGEYCVRMKEEELGEEWLASVALARAAESAGKGEADMVYHLALCYEEGKFAPQDYQRAAELYQKAAAMGHAPSQVALGGCYDAGRGVPCNSVKAASFYKLAAEQGNADGQYYLALCHYYGFGLARDHAEAKRLFSLAANQGHAEARKRLTSSAFQAASAPQPAQPERKVTTKPSPAPRTDSDSGTSESQRRAAELFIRALRSKEASQR